MLALPGALYEKPARRHGGFDSKTMKSVPHEGLGQADINLHEHALCLVRRCLEIVTQLAAKVASSTEKVSTCAV